jgi:hypothetical protein
MWWVPSPATVAVAAAPGASSGAPPSTSIAVTGPPGPDAAIPESGSLATAVSRTGPDAHPAGAPSRRPWGGVPSTRIATLAVHAESIPDPETATAWT